MKTFPDLFCVCLHVCGLPLLHFCLASVIILDLSSDPLKTEPKTGAPQKRICLGSDEVESMRKGV